MALARIRWGFNFNGKKYKPSRRVPVDLPEDVYAFADEHGLLFDEKKEKALGPAPQNKQCKG